MDSKELRKVLSVRSELETEQNCNTLTPPNTSGYSSISFLFSWAAQLGAWGPSLCWDMVLIPASSLQLIWTSCHWGHIIRCPPTSCECHICTQFNPSTVKVISWSPDIFNPMHLLFTQVHFFFWQLGWGQYVTDPQRSHIPSKISWTIWLLYGDQQHNHLLHNKYFWLLLQHYGPVPVHKA